MDEVFDEVANDGIKHKQHNEDGHEQVEDIGGQVDGISRRGDVRLEEHRAIFCSVTDFQAVHRYVHHRYVHCSLLKSVSSACEST